MRIVIEGIKGEDLLILMKQLEELDFESKDKVMKGFERWLKENQIDWGAVKRHMDRVHFDKEYWGCAYCNIGNPPFASYCMNCGKEKKIGSPFHLSFAGQEESNRKG